MLPGEVSHQWTRGKEVMMILPSRENKSKLVCGFTAEPRKARRKSVKTFLRGISLCLQTRKNTACEVGKYTRSICAYTVQ